MRSPRSLPAILILSVSVLAACGREDRCEAPALPRLLTVKDLTLDQKADAMGLPPSQVPRDAVGGPAFDDYVARHNDAARVGYCIESEAYKARAMKDEMNSIARAIMATCKEGLEGDTLAAVLKFRNCAAGNK